MTDPVELTMLTVTEQAVIDDIISGGSEPLTLARQTCQRGGMRTAFEKGSDITDQPGEIGRICSELVRLDIQGNPENRYNGFEEFVPPVLFGQITEAEMQDYIHLVSSSKADAIDFTDDAGAIVAVAKVEPATAYVAGYVEVDEDITKANAQAAEMAANPKYFELLRDICLVNDMPYLNDFHRIDLCNAAGQAQRLREVSGM